MMQYIYLRNNTQKNQTDKKNQNVIIKPNCYKIVNILDH